MNLQMKRGGANKTAILVMLVWFMAFHGAVKAENPSQTGTITHGRPYLVFDEWHTEVIQPHGLLVWRDVQAAQDASPFHICFIEYSASTNHKYIWLWSGADVGMAIVKAAYEFDIPIEDFVEGRSELVDKVANALHGSRSQDFWLLIGLVSSGEVLEFAETKLPRIASALGVLPTPTEPPVGANITPVPKCPIEAYLPAMPGENDPEAIVICVRVTPWTCTTGPVVFVSSTPSAGSFYCNYSQTTVCTATEQCANIICGFAVWAWTQTTTWTFVATATTGPFEAPGTCAAVPPPGTVPPPPPPPV